MKRRRCNCSEWETPGEQQNRPGDSDHDDQRATGADKVTEAVHEAAPEEPGDDGHGTQGAAVVEEVPGEHQDGPDDGGHGTQEAAEAEVLWTDC